MDCSVFSIVIVDDDCDDQYLMAVALQTECPAIKITSIANLDEWSAYWTIMQAAPSLVLMDLRLSAVRGLDLLGELKQHPRYRATPVIIWSSSTSQDEIQACYEAGAVSFIHKSSSIDALNRNVKNLCSWWLRTVRLP